MGVCQSKSVWRKITKQPNVSAPQNAPEEEKNIEEYTTPDCPLESPNTSRKTFKKVKVDSEEFPELTLTVKDFSPTSKELKILLKKICNIRDDILFIIRKFDTRQQTRIKKELSQYMNQIKCLVLNYNEFASLKSNSEVKHQTMKNLLASLRSCEEALTAKLDYVLEISLIEPEANMAVMQWLSEKDVINKKMHTYISHVPKKEKNRI